MGLDNGIILKADLEMLHKFGIKDWFDDSYRPVRYVDDEGNSVYQEYIHVVYERKWWGFRDAIVADFQDSWRYDGDGGDVRITSDDVADIITILKHFDNEEVWNSCNAQIWQYDEVKEYTIPQHFKMLKKLHKCLKYMEKHNIPYECYWYDSY